MPSIPTKTDYRAAHPRGAVRSVTSAAVRRLVALGCAAMVVSLGLPLSGHAAGAASSSPEDARAQLSQVRAREAQARVRLNLAVASDNAVIAEVGRLQRLVGAEQTIVAADLSAAQAADARVAVASQRIAQLVAQGQGAHRALVERAVNLYEHPYRDEQLLLDGAKSLDEMTTRQVLADAVQARTSDLVDAVRQEQIQQRAASADLTAAKLTADERHRASQDEVKRLQTAVDSHQQAHDALQKRIRDDDAEIAALAGQEAGLQARLNAAAAQFAPQIAAVIAVPPPPAQAGGVVGGTGLEWPLHAVVTQEFGSHPGIDIAAPYGTPIVAAGSGVVTVAGWEGGYGNYTCINHGGGISTCYGHQSSIAVSPGQTVNRGQYIGNEGSTGYSTGPHVHFEVRVNGSTRNPRDFIPGTP